MARVTSVRDDLALLGAVLSMQRGDAVRAEQPHQVVFERDEELRRARVALAAGTAAQLAVDAARFVALGADDRARPASAWSGRASWPELDVGAAAGHVGGDGDRARWPARATISASCWWYFAFSTECVMPRRLSMRDSVSDTSTEMVPTSTGWPRLWSRSISSSDRVVLLAPGLVDPGRAWSLRADRAGWSG